MNYRGRFLELREENNFSQRDIAKLLKISKSAYNQFEQQYTIIPIQRLNDVANIFDVSIDYLLGFTDKRKYKVMKKELDKKVVGERLKNFRKEYKLTQEKLANKIDTTHQVISRYERGTYIIATSFLYAICKKFEVSADYLLGRVDEQL